MIQTNNINELVNLLKSSGVGFVKGYFRTNATDVEVISDEDNSTRFKTKKKNQYNPFKIVFSDGQKNIGEISLPDYSRYATVGLRTPSLPKGTFGSLMLYLPFHTEAQSHDLGFFHVELSFFLPTGGEFLAYVGCAEFWTGKKVNAF